MPPKFSWVPDAAFSDWSISTPALRVLGVLCRYTNKNGYCFPSQSTIAKKLGLARSTVNYHIKKLRQLGYLEVERRTTGSGGETSCLYRITAPPEADSPEDPQIDIPDDPNLDTHADANINTRADANINTRADAGINTACQPIRSTQTYSLTDQSTRINKVEVVNLTRAREETAADFSDDSRETPDDPFGDTLWTTTPDAPETPEEVICQAILPGNKPDQVQYPETVAEALNHPDIQIYRRVTGVLPYASYYKAVVDAIQFLRESCPTDDSLVKYLTPFWQKWKSSTRKDGQPYNPNKPAWLTDWAVTSANSNPASDDSDEECRYSYSVTHNPPPARYARAATVVFEEV